MKEYKLQDTVEELARAGTNRRKGFADSRPEARARLSLRAFNTASQRGGGGEVVVVVVVVGGGKLVFPRSAADEPERLCLFPPLTYYPSDLLSRDLRPPFFFPGFRWTSVEILADRYADYTFDYTIHYITIHRDAASRSRACEKRQSISCETHKPETYAFAV